MLPDGARLSSIDFRFKRCVTLASGWTNLGVQTILAHDGKLLLGCKVMASHRFTRAEFADNMRFACAFAKEVGFKGRFIAGGNYQGCVNEFRFA